VKVGGKLFLWFSGIAILVAVVGGFGFYATTEAERVSANVENTKRDIVLMTSLAIILCFIAASFISNSILKPIRKLRIATEEIQKGNLKTRVYIKTKDELEELGDAFNETTEELAKTEEKRLQLEKAKTEFLSITSHELRSPMTPMKGKLQMLEQGYYGKLKKKQKEALEVVIRNADRLDKIIVDLLEVSRIEAARLKFVFKKANLEKTVEETVDYMKGFMPEKKIKVISKASKLPVIEVDADRVSQVLRNLINNAIKFSKNNTTVEVAAEAKEDHILFMVKDTGIGISQEDKARIFEPFFQAEQTIYREQGGTGLGLTICRGIIESQHGKIWVESKKGKGSIFYFTVPLKPVREIVAIKMLFSRQQSRILEPKRGNIK